MANLRAGSIDLKSIHSKLCLNSQST